jgi:hypothetical protein
MIENELAENVHNVKKTTFKIKKKLKTDWAWASRKCAES